MPHLLRQGRADIAVITGIGPRRRASAIPAAPAPYAQARLYRLRVKTAKIQQHRVPASRLAQERGTQIRFAACDHPPVNDDGPAAAEIVSPLHRQQPLRRAALSLAGREQ